MLFRSSKLGTTLVTLPSISRALKTARRAVFAPRDADAGLRLAVTASGCAPWAGLAFCDRCACSGFLFPPQAAVASAAGCSIPVLLYSLQCTIKKRKKLNQRQIVKDFLIKFTKNLQKRCQKHCMAPDTSFNRLHFSVQQVFAEIRIVWQLVDIWLPEPLDFG